MRSKWSANLFAVLTLLCICRTANAHDNLSGEVFYEIWVKSFADSNDPDHIGDLRGIIQRLDYLEDLGITSIKLSPIFDCGYRSFDPYANTHGYDIIDYYRINPLFGTRNDLRQLLGEAHRRGMKVIFDFVPNHTSNRHPWFIDASEGGTKRDWYVWQENPSTDWRIPWGGGKSWKEVWLKSNQSYYYSAFQFRTLPDLNYRNPEVVEEILSVVKYWLDFGFDGLRVDAARYLLEDGPGKAADTPGTHAFFRKLRTLLDGYSDPKVMIAESFTPDPAIIRTYYGNGEDEFHLCFDFPFAFRTAQAIHQQDVTALSQLLRYQHENYPKGSRPATFLANHDNVNPRPYTLFSNDPHRCVLAAGLNLLTYGTPFIYYGDEIGLEGGKGRGQDQDILLRKYFNWDAAAEQAANPNSMLSWYKRMIHIRKVYPALTHGSFEIVPCTDKALLAIVREYRDEALLLVFNVSATTRKINFDLSPYKWNNRAIYSVIGDYPTIPPFAFILVSIGRTHRDKLADWNGKISGGASEPALVTIRYPSMFLREGANGWTPTPMRRKADRIWEVVSQLEEGEYQFKFEIGGREIWEINWGDTNRDGTCEVDGEPITYHVSKAGDYAIRFDERDFSYKITRR